MVWSTYLWMVVWLFCRVKLNYLKLEGNQQLFWDFRNGFGRNLGRHSLVICHWECSLKRFDHRNQNNNSYYSNLKPSLAYSPLNTLFQKCHSSCFFIFAITNYVVVNARWNVVTCCILSIPEYLFFSTELIVID